MLDARITQNIMLVSDLCWLAECSCDNDLLHSQLNGWPKLCASPIEAGCQKNNKIQDDDMRC